MGFAYKFPQQEDGMEEIKEVEEGSHSNVDMTNTRILQETEVAIVCQPTCGYKLS